MYDYRENVKQDVLEYIEENVGYLKASNKDELEEELYDSLWTTDSVTGMQAVHTPLTHARRKKISMETGVYYKRLLRTSGATNLIQ